MTKTELMLGEQCGTCGEAIIGHRLVMSDPAMIHPWSWSHAGCGLHHTSRQSRAECRRAAEQSDEDHRPTLGNAKAN